MSCAGASEESKDKALEVLAIYLTDDELVDFSTYNMGGGTCRPEDRERFMALTNMHQHALYQLGLAIMDAEVEGEGAMEIFTDMLGMTAEALRQLKEAMHNEDGEQQQQPEEAQEGAPEVGGGSPGTDSGQVSNE